MRKTAVVLTFGTFVLLAASPAFAITKCTTPDGKISYQQMPCPELPMPTLLSAELKIGATPVVATAAGEYSASDQFAVVKRTLMAVVSAGDRCEVTTRAVGDTPVSRAACKHFTDAVEGVAALSKEGARLQSLPQLQGSADAAEIPRILASVVQHLEFLESHVERQESAQQKGSS